MVNFECNLCIRTLKKKQVERHFQFECRNSHNFTCLTCWSIFDRDSVKGHISCITEQEKYQKGDNTANAKLKNIQAKAVVKKVDLNELRWCGFKKTSKKILIGNDNYKLPIKELLEKLAFVYAKNNDADNETVDMDLLKKHTMNKLAKDNRFVIDLSKNTIRFKI
jgi:hypothetical protein